MTVKQIQLAFQLEQWQWTMRLEQLVLERQTRFMLCRIVDDGFNRVKADVDKRGTNTKCTAARAMAVQVDQGVVDKAHGFTQVDRNDAPPSRIGRLDKTTFKANVNRNKMDDRLKDLACDHSNVTMPLTHYTTPGLAHSCYEAQAVSRRR